MQGIECTKPGQLTLIDRPVPQRGNGEVLLRMLRAGICGTDMHIYGGNQPYFEYPRVIGHELSAEVLEADPDSGLRAGDLAFINPYIACGSCVACRAGKTNCCVRLSVLGVHCDGGLTQYLSLPAENVVKADGLDADEAAMVEFLAVGAHAVARAQVREGASVLVAGSGPIGIGVALFASLRGADVTVVDIREERLSFCASHLAVTTDQLGEGLRDRLLNRTAGEMFANVFDATGSPAAMEAGFSNVAHGGTYTLVSIVNARIGFEDPEFHKREMNLLSSRNAQPQDFELVVKAIRDGRVPTRAMNTHRVAFEDLPREMPNLVRSDSGTIKALVEIG